MPPKIPRSAAELEEENARLRQELSESRRETTQARSDLRVVQQQEAEVQAREQEGREQQTATAEILRAIASLPWIFNRYSTPSSRAPSGSPTRPRPRSGESMATACGGRLPPVEGRPHA